MNSYERYMNVIQGKPVDLLPRLPILMAYAAEHIGSNYGAFASDYRVLVEANLRCAADFRFDQLSAISDPYRETQGFGAEILFVENAVPRCLRPPLQDTKDLSVLKQPDPFNSTRMVDRVRAVESFKEKAFKEYSILGWVEGPASNAANLRGVTNFLMDLMDDPDFIKELMDRCTDVGIEFARAQIEAGADTIGVGDAIASQISAGIYEQFVAPFEKRLIDSIHEAGGIARLHICGDMSHLLRPMAQLGADIIDLDWKVDMVRAREVLNNTVIAGNIDPVNVVKNGTPSQISAMIQDIYQNIGNPYMVGAGCEIPSGTAPENVSALCSPVPYKE